VVQQLEVPAPPAAAKKVLARSHWRVLIRPGVYDDQRIASLGAAWGLIEGTAVSWRGWDFPHVGREEERGNGNSWIESATDWSTYLEFWRLYLSGQFVFLGVPREDLSDIDVASRVRELLGVPAGFVASGYLDPLRTLFLLTEICEFASRLARRGVVDKHGVIEVALDGAADRVLLFSDPFREWSRFYRATAPRLEVPRSTAGIEAPDVAHKLAIDLAVWTFERFGYTADRGWLEREQSSFVEGTGTWASLRQLPR
jgi:hypothetical protein